MPKPPKVEPIDDVGEFIQQMQAAAFAADLSVQAFQVAIQPGDFYARFVPDQDLMVYGEIIDSMAYWDTVAKPWSQETQAEHDSEVAHWDSHHMRNQRSTRSYSVMCVDGELGSVHVATMTPITQAQFETLKAAGWPDSIAGCRDVLRAMNRSE